MPHKPTPLQQDAQGNDSPLRMKLNPFSLEFRDDCKYLEKPFIKQYTQSSLKKLRFALGLGVVMYAVFGILDYVMVPELIFRFWFVRYAIVCPSIVAVILLSYSSIFGKIMQPALAILMFIASGGIIYMTMAGPPAISQSYYAGLMLVLMLGYSVVRARFVWASMAGSAVVCSYLLLSAGSQQLPLIIVVANNYFCIAANLLGMVASYNLEFYARRDYFISHLLHIERQKVVIVNQQLEQTVQKRTAMLALANEELRHEIEVHQQLDKEKKQLEDQLRQAQKMEAIGTLAGGIAHDFNNILAAIMGHAELALMQISQKEKAEKYLAEVLNASDRAKDLVSQILAFSRQSDSDLKPIQISIVIKEALRLIRATLPTTITIKREFKDQESIVVGNATQIHQILMNLCTNAAHAMETTGGNLSVSLKNYDIDIETLHRIWPSPVKLGPGRYVQLTVTDSGQGIAPTLQERIFDPYFTTKKKGVGTGLGLAVVHGIVQNHGGTIDVQSHPGNGTTFAIYLPRIESKIQPEIKKLQAIPNGNEKILLVDDDPALADLGGKLLTALGYQVTSFTDPQIAIKRFRSDPDFYNLVITDLIMPGLTGDKLADEILELRPNIPIIVSTGFSDNIRVEHLKKVGIKGVLHKPITTYHLAKEVRQALDEQTVEHP